jgi:prefoldin subunit 5
MSLTVTDLAEEVRETNRRLTAAIDALRTEVTDLRVEVAKINTNLNWLKGIGRIVAGSAVAVLILVGTGVYRFGRVETAIAELQRDTGERFGRVETSIASLQRDTGELRKDATEFRAEFKARDDRLSRMLERVEKALPPVSKGNP